MKVFIALIVALISPLVLCSSLRKEISSKRSSGDGLTVQTSIGVLQGHYNEVGIREWKGIPFAKPPQGELRWEYPQPAEPFSEVYVADKNVNGCPQLCNLPPGNCPAYGTSEDCLYLSVFAPTEPAPTAEFPNGYPVFFWIHGGAFEQGLGNCALYNGTTFAQKNVITVAVNYRLGAFGFMASKSMQGNYGFMDQRLALEWTGKNIAAFGGDPTRITIGGQSAGAMSVGAHYVAPGSQSLFQAGIMESNPFALPFHTRESAGSNADSVFEYCGCAADDVACMKTKPIDLILEAQSKAIKLDLNTLLVNFLPFAPMVEPGGEIPEQPFTAMAAGRMKNAPILSGSVTDEGQLFIYELFTKPVPEPVYQLIIKAVFGLKNAKEILSMYPFDIVPNSQDGRDALNILATDLIFYCPLRNVTRGYENFFGMTHAPTFTYRFKHVESFDCWGPNYQFCLGTVCHGSELPYVFNVFSDGFDITYTPTPEEVQLSVDMGSSWANFITSNDPNKGYATFNYPEYEPLSDKLVILDEPDHSTTDHLRAKYCDAWDRLGYYY